MQKCFGIISYLTWDQPQRKQRQDRLERLIKQLSDLWPDIPILIIAQQWEDYTLEGKCKNKIYKFDYEPLGILKARQTLREKFLELEFDYLIMFDDDAIIEYDNKKVTKEYMKELDNHPNGFCFILGGNEQYCPYAPSQLNLCAISRFIYEMEPMVEVDAQKSQGYEDSIYSTLLHNKYPQYEFNAPEGIRCCHFNNPNIKELGGEVPSTWCNSKDLKWVEIGKHSLIIEEYIFKHKDIPNLKIYYEFNELVSNNIKYEEYVREKNQKKVDFLVSRYPDRVKPIMRDALERAYKLK